MDDHNTKSGFFQTLYMQTVNKPHSTWNDLKALGYDETLTLQSKQGRLPNDSAATAVEFDDCYTRALRKGPAGGDPIHVSSSV
jgi:hypothetical protein